MFLMIEKQNLVIGKLLEQGVLSYEAATQMTEQFWYNRSYFSNYYRTNLSTA